MKRIVFCLTLLIAAPALAQEDIIDPAMVEMSCLEIVDEINAASEVLGGAPERGLISEGSAITLASNVGRRIAIQEGNSDLSTAIGLAGRFLRSRSERNEAEEAARREEATRTWYYLSGMYDGRSCDDLIADEYAARMAEEAAQTEAGESAHASSSADLSATGNSENWACVADFEAGDCTCTQSVNACNASATRDEAWVNYCCAAPAEE